MVGWERIYFCFRARNDENGGEKIYAQHKIVIAKREKAPSEVKFTVEGKEYSSVGFIEVVFFFGLVQRLSTKRFREIAFLFAMIKINDTTFGITFHTRSPSDLLLTSSHKTSSMVQFGENFHLLSDEDATRVSTYTLSLHPR